MSRRSTLPPRKLLAKTLPGGEATSGRLSVDASPEHDGDDEMANSSDESSVVPFDLAAAVGFLQSVSSVAVPSSTTSGVPTSSSSRKRGKSSAFGNANPNSGSSAANSGRWPKKAPVVNETAFCYTLRGPNSLLKPDKSAVFTIGGVYELKCAVLSPQRSNYTCRTVLSLMCDDAEKFSELESQWETGVLLSGQPVPKQIMTMDRPSPRTHKNVKAGWRSLEFTWDASGTIFVYLRFLCALADLTNATTPLRLVIESSFLEEPLENGIKTLLLETVGHPSLIDISLGSPGPIDLLNDTVPNRTIPEDIREPLFEGSPLELDDTDFVRNVINSVAKNVAASGQENPMAMIEKAIQNTLQATDEASGKFSVRVSAATLGEALGSFLTSASSSSTSLPAASTSTASASSSVSTIGAMHQPRPRGRPRKFHYPEYCYSKTALQKGPSHSGEWRGPAAEMMAIQEMQRISAPGHTEPIPEKRFKMDIYDERPINMASLFNNTLQNDDADKPSSSMEDVEPSEDVKNFLTSRKMENFVPIFAKYSMSEMRCLSAEDCRIICANDAEGLRLYHALRQRSFSSGKLRIFVAPQSDDGEEPCYELLNLTPPCASELEHSLRGKQLIGSETRRLCISGPKGILVQISDEIIESWDDNSVFQFSVTNNTLKMEQIGGQ